MSERLTRIDLRYQIPGPATMDTPLAAIEIVCLNQTDPVLLQEIQEGRRWQDH